jgi:hypothetical protein
LPTSRRGEIVVCEFAPEDEFKVVVVASSVGKKLVGPTGNGGISGRMLGDDFVSADRPIEFDELTDVVGFGGRCGIVTLRCCSWLGCLCCVDTSSFRSRGEIAVAVASNSSEPFQPSAPALRGEFVTFDEDEEDDDPRPATTSRLLLSRSTPSIPPIPSSLWVGSIVGRRREPIVCKAFEPGRLLGSTCDSRREWWNALKKNEMKK